MVTATTPVFAGVSSYASDLQQVITRAVNIAAMPLQQMSNQRQDMSAESTALNGLDTKFSALQTAIQDLDSALGPSSYAATSSDPSMVAASVSSGALEATYTIDVSSIGSYSAAVSSASLPVANPYSASISASSAFTLTVNGKTFDIKPGGASLMALAQAINGASAGVQASIVNLGGSGSPQYRLALRSNNLGPDSMQLNDGSLDLLDSLGTGELASYTVNGLGDTPIASSSRTVTLAPGVTVDILQPTSQPVTVTVSRTTDSIGNALSAFVNAYNAAVDQLDQQVGQNAGALSGQSIVRSLFSSLRQINQYSAPGGAVRSLSRMGVELDSHGKLSFDASKLDSQNVQTIQSFLGSTSEGGFLKAANDALNAVENSTSGSLKSAIEMNTEEIGSQDDRIAKEQQRILDLQASLQQQMATADALIASLESQRTFMNNLFTAMMNANNTGGVKS